MSLEQAGGLALTASDMQALDAAGLSDRRDLPRSRKDSVVLDVRLLDRRVHVQLSPRAVAAAEALQGPLTAEMELYFSCMIRKAVRFRAEVPDTTLPDGAYAPLIARLGMQFRPVTTQHCHIEPGADAPPLETMPVTRPQAFVPRWLTIDFHHGAWLGEFGY